MARRYLTSILALLFIGFFSLAAYTDNKKGQESFESTCIKDWMKKADEAKSKIDYQNFGEKYCSCIATQPFDNRAAVNKATQLCMSQTLLHDSMDSLEEEIGLKKGTEDIIEEYCQDRWDLIYPQVTDSNKETIIVYCQCAKTQLMQLIKTADQITEKQYNEQINIIAASCVDKAQAAEASTKTTTE